MTQRVRRNSLLAASVVIALAVVLGPAAAAVRTFLVKDVASGTASSTPTAGTQQAGLLAFAASPDGVSHELFVSLGTNATTTRLRNGTSVLQYSSVLSTQLVCGGTILLAAVGTGTQGEELAVASATGAFPPLLLDLSAGAASSSPAQFTNLDSDTAIFAATTPSAGREIWAFACSSRSAALVEDVRSGSGSSDPQTLTAAGPFVYFTASTVLSGRELHRTDGTSSGTQLVADLAALSLSPTFSTTFAALGNALVFGATVAGVATTLYKTEGTAATTSSLGTFLLSSTFGEVAVANSTVFFAVAASASIGRELYANDGTPGSSWLVRDAAPGSSDGDPQSLTPVGSSLYFTADDGSNGRELWKTGGTPATAALVCDLRAGAASASPAYLTAFADASAEVAFTASTGSDPDRRVFLSSGDCASTTELAYAPSAESSHAPVILGALGNTLYVSAANNSLGAELQAITTCAEGTFVAAGGGCTMCSACGSGLEVAAPCSVQNDTVCQTATSGGSGAAGVGSETTHWYTETNLQLGAGGFALLLFLLLCLCYARKRARTREERLRLAIALRTKRAPVKSLRTSTSSTSAQRNKDDVTQQEAAAAAPSSADKEPDAERGSSRSSASSIPVAAKPIPRSRFRRHVVSLFKFLGYTDIAPTHAAQRSSSVTKEHHKREELRVKADRAMESARAVAGVPLTSPPTATALPRTPAQPRARSPPAEAASLPEQRRPERGAAREPRRHTTPSAHGPSASRSEGRHTDRSRERNSPSSRTRKHARRSRD